MHFKTSKFNDPLSISSRLCDNTAVEKLINDIKRYNSNLKTAEIEGMLGIILDKPGITTAELIVQTGIPKETAKEFIRSISSILENKNSDRVSLNESTQKMFSIFKLQPFPRTLLAYENVELKEKIIQIRQKYFFAPERKYDQFFCTPDTAVTKAMVIKNKGVIDKGRIAFLGDDDLVSVALALLDQTYTNITVFDIDSRVLEVLENITKDLNIKNIRFQIYDVRDKLGDEFFEKFDVVVTDPPYTVSGIDLFLKRSVELLANKKDFSKGYVFMQYGNSFKSPEKFLKIQETISSYNFVIEDRINKFAKYEGADSIGNSSSLYILKSNSFTKPRTEYFRTLNMYTFDNQKVETFPYIDHLIFKVFDVDANTLTSKTKLMKAAGDFCRIHKLKVVESSFFKFKGGGITLGYILSSSNLTMHTWPEHRALHIDLITCTPLYNKEVVTETVSGLFGSDKVELLTLPS